MPDQAITQSRSSTCSDVAMPELGAEAPEVLQGYYQQMALVRAFELRAAEMYTRAKIGGYCHLNLGEEATVVGLMAALGQKDYLFTTYREHGYALARGLDPGRVMAELFGKATGVSGGWGGSMHLFDASARLLGGYGVVGGQIPPATGAALAVAYRSDPGPEAEAVMCLMGDAATNIGAFHESLNLAAIWHLPIVYVVVNNGLGMGTPVEAAAGEPELFRRGCAYRIPGVRVDGNDVLAVRDAAERSPRRGARRATAHPARGGLRPPARALSRRPGPLPLAGGKRAAARPRPGADVPLPADRGWRARRRRCVDDRGRCRRGRLCGGRLRRREPATGARPALRPWVCHPRPEHAVPASG